MAIRVKTKPMAANGGSYSFDGGVCDCAIVKTIGAAAPVYGGQAMQKLTTLTDFNANVFEIWGLQDAPQGVVAVSGLTSTNSIETYSGISTTATFPNDTDTNEHHLGSGSNEAVDVTVNTTEDDCILVALGTYRGTGITYMYAVTGGTIISVDPPSGGNNLSVESSPLAVGAAGSHTLVGLTGGGDVNIVISMSVAALTPGPLAVASAGSFFPFY